MARRGREHGKQLMLASLCLPGSPSPTPALRSAAVSRVELVRLRPPATFLPCPWSQARLETPVLSQSVSWRPACRLGRCGEGSTAGTGVKPPCPGFVVLPLLCSRKTSHGPLCQLPGRLQRPGRACVARSCRSRSNGQFEQPRPPGGTGVSPWAPQRLWRPRRAWAAGWVSTGRGVSALRAGPAGASL